MTVTRAFDGTNRVVLWLAAVILVAQACVVTAEKKIYVTPDGTDEDQAAVDTAAEDTEPVEDVAKEDSATPEDTTVVPQEQWDIGPDGGTFQFLGGVTLVVPPGAFPVDINVFMGEQSGAILPEEVTALTAVLRIEVDDEEAQFNAPVLLVVPLDDELVAGLEDSPDWTGIAGFSQPLSGDEDWEEHPASVNLVEGKLIISTYHFSLFFGGLGQGGGSTCTPEDEVCNSADDDCDGEIDEGACAAGDGCFMNSMCESGTCAWIYGGTEAVCAETSGGCVIIIDEVETQVEDLGILCTSDTAFRQCKEGAFTESAECADEFEGKYLCDDEAGECAGECGVDEDCEDLLLCDGGTVCQTGQCVPDGQAVVCPEDTQCSTWQCVDATGDCEEVPANTDESCEDGDLCTEGDVCAGILCVAGSGKDCDDENECTTDSCTSPTGDCVNDALLMEGEPCDDADLCTEVDTCDGMGVCSGTDKVCDDLNACTVDSCDAGSGDCLSDPLTGEPCDDLDECTTTDACTDQGMCVGVLSVDCDDLNDCTQDSCDPANGACVHLPAEVDTPCSYPDASAGAGSDCYPDSACDDAGTCQPGEGVCDCQVDGDCPDDGDLCNGVQTCDTGSFPYTCVDDPESIVECAPGGTCFELACDPGTGDCLSSAINDGGVCDDDNVCTTGEICSEAECTNGVLDDCDDLDPCSVDSCDPFDGCQHSPAPAFPCSDDDDCTVDTCSEDGTSCLFVEIPGCCATDLDCGGMPCVDGSCCVAVCDDGQGGPTWECGDNGCGGTCGECQGVETCNEETHACVCETCCQDSSTCAALEICLDPGSGETECMPLFPLFKARFDDETAGEASSKFTTSWLNPAWVVFEAASSPEFANSPTRSMRYNKYKSNGWIEFSASLPGGGKAAFFSMMIFCPVPPTQNWTMLIKGDGGTIDSVSSQQVCGTGEWHHIVAPVTALGDGSHTFQLDLENSAFGTIYLDDVAILAEE